MKKLMLGLCFVFGGIVAVNAQEIDTTGMQPQQQQNQTMDDQDRQPIQVSELPDAVRTSLESQDYSGWTVSSAFRSTKSGDDAAVGSNEEIYIVELRSGADTKTVKFDAEGNKIDDQKEDQK